MDMALPKTWLYMTYDITLETSVEAFLQRKWASNIYLHHTYLLTYTYAHLKKREKPKNLRKLKLPTNSVHVKTGEIWIHSAVLVSVHVNFLVLKMYCGCIRCKMFIGESGVKVNKDSIIFATFVNLKLFQNKK